MLVDDSDDADTVLGDDALSVDVDDEDELFKESSMAAKTYNRSSGLSTSESVTSTRLVRSAVLEMMLRPYPSILAVIEYCRRVVCRLKSSCIWWMTVGSSFWKM